MDKLDSVLTTAVITKCDGQETHLSTPTKATLLVAKQTLNQYYFLMDNSAVYHLALSKYHFTHSFTTDLFTVVLHPWHKLGYFDDQAWLPEWKDNARQLLECTYKEYKEAYDTQVGDRAAMPIASPTRWVHHFFFTSIYLHVLFHYLVTILFLKYVQQPWRCSAPCQSMLPFWWPSSISCTTMPHHPEWRCHLLLD